MGIEIYMWNGSQIELAAPLAPNLNDKGTAFAGSIDALLDLAGWSVITLALRDAGLEADVMIVKSTTEYLAAIRSDMTAASEISGREFNRIVDELDKGGRSRVELEVRLCSNDRMCAHMNAGYVVIGKSNPPAEESP